MDNSDLTFEDIPKSLNELRHTSVCLSLEMGTWFKEPLRPAMARKIKQFADVHRTSNTNYNYRRSLATNNTVYSGPALLPNTPSPTSLCPLVSMEGVKRTFSTVSDYMD